MELRRWGGTYEPDPPKLEKSCRLAFGALAASAPPPECEEDAQPLLEIEEVLRRLDHGVEEALEAGIGMLADCTSNSVSLYRIHQGEVKIIKKQQQALHIQHFFDDTFEQNRAAIERSASPVQGHSNEVFAKYMITRASIPV
jgi:hypothetical protein